MPRPRKSECKGLKPNGSACEKSPRPGFEYCHRHMDQRPLTSEEQELMVYAQATLNRLKPALEARFPVGMARNFILRLGEAAKFSPETLAWLAAPSQQPDHEAERTVEQWASWLETQLADSLSKLLIDGEGGGGPLHLQGRRRSLIDPLPVLLKFPSDRIHLGTVVAFSHVEEWTEREGFWRGYTSSSGRDQFAMHCGFRVDPGEAIWKTLLSRGEAAIKAHYALFARLYEQTSGEPGRWASMDINQFCSDLGYKKHKGAFKPERKQQAVRLLEILTSLDIHVERIIRKNPLKRQQLRGPLWQRGLMAEEQDLFGNLFGTIREGDPSLWDPIGFTYGPGPWFSDPTWRQQNKYLGLIGSGLMTLQPDQDQVAIRIAGYMGTLARFEHYQNGHTIRIETLLNRTGLDSKYPRDPWRLEKVVTDALDKLASPEVGIFASWDYTEGEPEEPDMEDPEALTALANYKPTAWRRKVLVFHWPQVLGIEGKRLRDAQREQIAAEQKKKATAEQKKLPPSV